MAGTVVIAGTDGSDQSLQAVEWAAREAALRAAELRIVSVPTLPPLMSWQRGPQGTTDTVAATSATPNPTPSALTRLAAAMGTSTPALASPSSPAGWWRAQLR